MKDFERNLNLIFFYYKESRDCSREGATGKEAKIAKVVAGRLKQMGAVVSGIDADTSVEKMAEFDFDMLDDTRRGSLSSGESDYYNQPELTLTRNIVKGKLRDIFFSRKVATEAGSTPEEMTDAIMSILDAHANVWAMENNRLPDEWYPSHIEDIRRVSRADSRYLYQNGVDKWYYSPLEQTVNAIPMDKMTVDQLRGMLSKNGVKAEEVWWTGLDDYLATRKNVTRQEVLDYLRDNNVELKEIRRGEPQRPDSPEARWSSYALENGRNYAFPCPRA